jgi:FRG domain-containing protein
MPSWLQLLLDIVLPSPSRSGKERGKDAMFDGARWQRTAQSDGTVTFRLASWSSYFDFLEAEVFKPALPSKQNYIWRGQRRSNWSLSSSLDRLFQSLGLLTDTENILETRSESHLQSFKRASRGRRGLNPVNLTDKNDWWALGQHFGLATPLLDWTRSPFAAAYFAFEERSSDSTEHRIVYGLDQNAILQKNHELINGPSQEKGRPPTLDFIDPMLDENQRLLSQDGLFTRAPIGIPIEQWIARAFEGSPSAVLLRVEIPDSDRLICLQALNRMNINHLSLFPDLIGASRSTNLKLELE